MLAYQLEDHSGHVVERRIPIPEPEPDEIRVKTYVSGLCHTDLHVAQEHWDTVDVPRTLGHEGVGVVDAVGSKVSKFKLNDRVGLGWLGDCCGRCPLCCAGKVNLCSKQKPTGYKRNGTLAEYFVAKERFAEHVPKGLSSRMAAPGMCGGVTAYRAVRMTDPQPGHRTVIVGAGGGLGHLAVQYAKAMGLEVIAVGLFNEEKSEFVRSLGADFVVSCTRGEPASEGGTPSSPVVQEIQRISQDKPIRSVILFAPSVSAVSEAIEYVSPNGVIVSVILPKAKVSLDLAAMTMKELTLKTFIGALPGDIPAALKYMEEGKVKVHVTEKSLDEVPSMLAALEAGTVSGRIVFRIRPEAEP